MRSFLRLLFSYAVKRAVSKKTYSMFMLPLIFQSLYGASPEIVLPLLAPIKASKTLYQTGNYLSALEVFNPYSEETIAQSPIALYLIAMCHIQLENFTLAANYLKKIETDHTDYQNKILDFYYHYGQVLFSLQQYHDAIEKFNKSIKIRHEQETSLYYLGYIYNILHESEKSREAYRKILTSQKTASNASQSNDIRQASQYAILKIDLDKLENLPPGSKDFFISKKILPTLNKIIGYNPHSSIAEEANALIARFNIQSTTASENHYLNGNPYPNAWMTMGSLTGLYDTNLQQQPTTITSPQNTQSFGIKSNLFIRKDWVVEKKWNIAPLLQLQTQNVTGNTENSMQTNNYYNATGTLHTGLEYSMAALPVGTAIDIGGSVQSGYWLQEKNLSWITWSPFLSFSHRIDWSSTSNIMLLGSYTLLQHLRDKTFNNATIVLRGSYSKFLSQWLIQMHILGKYIASENPYIAAHTLSLQPYIYWINLLPTMTALLSGEIGYVYSLEQLDTRGLEIAYGLQAQISKNLSSWFAISLSWKLNATVSKLKNVFDYSKHTFELSSNITF